MRPTTTSSRPEARRHGGVFKALHAYIERRRRNHGLRRVMELNDQQLRDIGLTRGDIAAMMR